ncbi:hypothetical protein LOZ80_22070 [Paenibacillus sp. HWE-109]|uniref:hypothetical protein n=1 Tax=Paenibacillus sp. HWE-109 TaxID=1306526 RepID=UPI001EE063F1|nr:hypothetical protein [Paenibacillus sp. HWE-109]UKS24308.1 hypothetical protein LOZ80_22070 [Paenibacillus sp. HWE-109]
MTIDPAALAELIQVKNKIGTNADTSGTNTLFARLAQIAAYVDQVEGYTDTLETLLGFTGDAASGTGSVMARLAQLNSFLGTVNTNVNTANTNITANGSKIGSNTDSSGTATLFALLKKLDAKGVGQTEIQPTYTRTASIPGGQSNLRNPRVWYTIADIQNKKGVIMACYAFGSCGSYDSGGDSTLVGGIISYRLTIDDQVETINFGFGPGPFSNTNYYENYGFGLYIIDDNQFYGGDNTYRTFKRQDALYFSKNFKFEVMINPTQTGFTNNQVLLTTNIVRYALHVGQ